MSSKDKSEGARDRAGMTRLVRELLRPYRGWLTVIFIAMIVETAMSLAGPWPLKIVLDSVIGHHPMPHWVTRMVGPDVTDHRWASPRWRRR